MELQLASKESKRRLFQRHHGLQNHWKSLFILIMGYILGCLFPLTSLLRRSSHFLLAPFDSTTSQSSTKNDEVFLQLEHIPFRPTSHTDSNGLAIQKQQLVEAFRVVDNLAGISVATLQPKQAIESHAHQSMHEFFYVLQGQGQVVVDERTYTAKPGSFIHAAPFQRHSFVATTDEPWQFLTIGLTTDKNPIG